MSELFNPELDRDAIRHQLQTTGLAQIPDYLPSSTADRLHACLDKEVRWDLAYSRAGKGQQVAAADLALMSPAAVRETVACAFDQQQPGFRFVYNTFRVIDAWSSGKAAEHPLVRLADSMHTSDHLQHVRDLTGLPAIKRMNVIAARYLPGHFLTPHDDAHAGEGREVTWILNLTRNWQPEWGGLLHLMDADQRQITHTLIPRFNTMVLFRPPLWHFVSQVANFARMPRYTLTGWMLST